MYHLWTQPHLMSLLILNLYENMSENTYDIPNSRAQGSLSPGTTARWVIWWRKYLCHLQLTGACCHTRNKGYPVNSTGWIEGNNKWEGDTKGFSCCYQTPTRLTVGILDRNIPSCPLEKIYVGLSLWHVEPLIGCFWNRYDGIGRPTWLLVKKYLYFAHSVTS